MKKLITIAFALTFLGCPAESISRSDSGNPEVRVGLIGHIPEHSCDIYAVQDGNSRRVIVTVCPNVSATNSAQNENCGKNCTETVNYQVVPAVRP